MGVVETIFQNLAANSATSNSPGGRLISYTHTSSLRVLIGMKSTKKASASCATGKRSWYQCCLTRSSSRTQGSACLVSGSWQKVELYRTVRSARDNGAFSLDVVEAVIGGSPQSAAEGMLRYGMLEGNIGYIYPLQFYEKCANRLL